MALPGALTTQVPPLQNHSSTSADRIRQRALARLYERKSAVDQLIRSLERYQQSQAIRRARCVPISAESKLL